MQAFQSSKQRYTTLCNVIQCYSTLYQKYCAFSLVISPIFSTFVPLLITTKNQSKMINSNHPSSICPQSSEPSMGRTELAQRYFPFIQPQNAWQKLRALLSEDPGLAYLTTIRRRSFLPSEVNIIYQHLGHP